MSIKLNEAIRVSPEPVRGELWTHRDTRDAHTQGRPYEEAARGQPSASQRKPTQPAHLDPGYQSPGHEKINVSVV